MAERVELARKLLDEAKGYVRKGEAIQASEKLYKVAEEALKYLSNKYAAEVSQEASKGGRWTTALLFKAAETIADKLGENVRRSWNTAWTLHVEGFHEANLGIGYVTKNMKDVEELVRVAEKETHLA